MDMGFWYIAGVWPSPAKAGVESEERGSGYAGWCLRDGIDGIDDMEVVESADVRGNMNMRVG